MIENTIARWHQLVASNDPSGLDDLLHDDAIFHSPVVFTPQEGKAKTQMYLTAAFFVFFNNEFRYVREVVGQNDAVLEFETVIDGITVNGVDMISWGEDGRITDFKVMLRPLKGVNIIHQMMAEMLKKAS
ncbi:MAG: nuclear transport factor 2 family protein [Proteobacteria bacterium]|nr:nuclear transport factor 2 family protein [Pseudomonadota bacterium]